ncbi:GNAT family N-acetyltransferase [Thalassotalea eurytherma]|uniref:Ferrichrome ABC transporter substrate-binding protein n=1 Tax=Thalassotalea eurytherma TaxID=1144278 RepID=A0ABQ6H6E5_9GAMM|nr:GNAT family N-acetyltransferase [Thalassotalea eurytherma]GLX83712.1 ferrichrome ABC transporter substrate-binding protein [Thalassotalea eurytherma]
MSASYQTSRLQISERLTSKQTPEFLASIVDILTPNVVENLPPYFQNVNSISAAQHWLAHINSDCRLLVVKLTGTNSPIGFVFISSENTNKTHVGYLLSEAYWGYGYATEILQGLLEFIRSEGQIMNLVAGVAPDNVASIKLLHKLGFNKVPSNDNGAVFFEYQL